LLKGNVTPYRTAWGAVLWLLLLTSAVYGLAESTAPDGSNAQDVWLLGETGEDVNIGLIAGGNIRETHEAFYEKDSNGLPVGDSHAFCYDFSGDGVSITLHETMMGGIIASRGGQGFPDDIGAAPGSNIHSARVLKDNGQITINYIENALQELVLNQNCRVIVTGFQFDPDTVTPNGQSQWSMLYDYYAYEHNVLFALAAGNVENEVTVFGDCYNGITTGGLIVTDPDVYRKVGSGSNPGPTLDDRLKPELTAPSQNQTVPSVNSDTSWTTHTSSAGATSYATPHTGGVAALLLGLADDTISEPDDGQNDVIKAAIVNSTFPNILDKSGYSTNPAEPNNVWHTERGYGRIDALRAYELLAAGKVYKDTPILAEKGWAYETITTAGQEDTYQITGSKNHRLVLTVTWNRKIRKISSNYSEESSPKFNLDLSIVKIPEELSLYEETNTLDNLEKVDIVLPEDGTYEIVLKNSTTKTNRAYAMAFELLPPLGGDIDLDYIVDYNDLSYLTEEWLEQGTGLDADLWPDEQVDMTDFSVLADRWMMTDERYYSE